MIEQEFTAGKEVERRSCNKNQVGRIASMDNILHALLAEHLEQKARLVVKGTEVFLDIFDRTIRFGERVAVNLDAFQLFVFQRVILRFRTNDRNLCAGLFQSQRFLPYTAVKRYREVFDYNTDFFTSKFHDNITSRILHSSAEFPRSNPSGVQDPGSVCPDTCGSNQVFRDS